MPLEVDKDFRDIESFWSDPKNFATFQEGAPVVIHIGSSSEVWFGDLSEHGSETILKVDDPSPFSQTASQNTGEDGSRPTALQRGSVLFVSEPSGSLYSRSDVLQTDMLRLNMSESGMRTRGE